MLKNKYIIAFLIILFFLFLLREEYNSPLIAQEVSKSYIQKYKVPTCENCKPISYAELKAFIVDDQTDKLIYTGDFICGDFTEKLIENAYQNGISSWPIFVGMKPISHMFAAFLTTDKGMIWIEPQTDEEYKISNVGEPLCTSSWCWKSRVDLIRAVYPREGDNGN